MNEKKNQILDNNVANEHLLYNRPVESENLLTADKLIRKNASNLEEAEKLIDEEPLRTDKTTELERREREEEI